MSIVKFMTTEVIIILTLLKMRHNDNSSFTKHLLIALSSFAAFMLLDTMWYLYNTNRKPVYF